MALPRYIDASLASPPGLGAASRDARIAEIGQEMAAARARMLNAQRTGNAALYASGQAALKRLNAERAALFGVQAAADRPGAFMSTLATFSDAVTGAVSKAAEGVASLPGALGKALPLLGIGAVALAVLYLTKGGRR
jgi:hypothetical protein